MRISGEIEIKEWTCEGPINRWDLRDHAVRKNETSYWVKISAKNSKSRVCDIYASRDGDPYFYEIIRPSLPSIISAGKIKALCISSNYVQGCGLQALWAGEKLLAATPKDQLINRVRAASLGAFDTNHFLSGLFYLMALAGVFDILFQIFRKRTT